METRPIPSAPGYSASADGRVWRRGRALSPRSNGHGYLRVKLSIGNVQRDAYVHRLVCEAFHGQAPANHAVRHLDGTRSNNAATNLEWATKAVNEAAKVLHGTLNWGERNGQRKMTAAQVIEARRRVAAGEMRKDVAADFGVSPAAIGDAVSGRRWKRLAGGIMEARRTA